MIRQPVQRRIGVDQIQFLGWPPRSQILVQPFDLGRCFPSGGNHFGRAFDADDGGVRPSFLEQSGYVARAGAEVGCAPHQKIRNAHQKIDRRS
jgi:hypothetical protein